MSEYDVAIIGAGFGGLGCALTLAERGARVALFERLTYPGGCASTFFRRGYGFEAGATLFSGFGPGQPMQRWMAEHGMNVTFTPLDPVVELRAGDVELAIPPDRERLIAMFCALPGAPVARLRQFFAFQKTIADTLWRLFDDPSLLPPFGAETFIRHIRRSPAYLKLLPLISTSLHTVLAQHELEQFAPLRIYLDAVCQITVQAGVDDVEAPFALAAMDYYFRGTGHIEGGIGELAQAFVNAAEDCGADVFLADGVRGLARVSGKWEVTSRRRTVRAKHVVANLLPRAVADLLDTAVDDVRPLSRINTRVEQGWGAAMLYLVLDPHAACCGPQAHHLELVDDVADRFVEGNHLFVSISGRDEMATRNRPGVEPGITATVSTHVDAARMTSMSDDEQVAYIDAVHQRMRDVLAARAPEVHDAVTWSMTASPRTFARFTGRPHGFVGGIPRRVGLANYRDVWPGPVLDDLYLVGDSVFPGQSTLATAVGGARIAARLSSSGLVAGPGYSPAVPSRAR